MLLHENLVGQNRHARVAIEQFAARNLFAESTRRIKARELPLMAKEIKRDSGPQRQSQKHPIDHASA
jgi:hypothetical protein